MLKITIPTPCHESWNNMIPDAEGRHCNACAKTVVDFSVMNDEAVKNYLLKNRDQRICGRFSTDQLQNICIELPQNIFQLDLPWWKRFLVASLIVFSTSLFSCEVKTTGQPAISNDPVEMNINNHLTIDTTLKIKTIDTIPPINQTHLLGDTVVVQSFTQGDIAIAPITPEKITELPVLPDTVPTAVIKTSSCNKLIKGEISLPVKTPRMLLGEPALTEDTTIKPPQTPHVIMGKMMMVKDTVKKISSPTSRTIGTGSVQNSGEQ